MVEDDFAGWLATLPKAWIEGCPASVFATARGAYGTPGRHYHVWDHVKRCAEELRGFPCEIPRPVFLALVFHDAVYIPGSRDNERLSAALAKTVLAQHARLPAGEVQAIERMILATADHHRKGRKLPEEERAVIDIDLATLGAPPAEYDRYADAVRREFCPVHAGEAAWRAGRIAFLRRMLEAPHVFLTDYGRKRWEDAARANMVRELARLESGRGFLERILARFARR